VIKTNTSLVEYLTNSMGEVDYCFFFSAAFLFIKEDWGL